MLSSNAAVTLSVRILPQTRDKLDELSHATGRTKSFLAAEAIENYLATQAWQVRSIKNAVKKASSSDACFIDHKKVVDWVNSWDSEREKGMPE
jgi:RHH-type rel operon transcriptional repressor/antitoxin RelB